MSTSVITSAAARVAIESGQRAEVEVDAVEVGQHLTLILEQHCVAPPRSVPSCSKSSGCGGTRRRRTRARRLGPRLAEQGHKYCLSPPM